MGFGKFQLFDSGEYTGREHISVQHHFQTIPDFV